MAAMTEQQARKLLIKDLSDFQEYICFVYNLEIGIKALSKFNNKGQYTKLLNEINDIKHTVAQGNISENDVTNYLPIKIENIVNQLSIII